jgi:hypothetical protein
MKKATVLLLGSVLLIASLTDAHAWFGKKKADSAGDAGQPAAAVEQKAAPVEKKKTDKNLEAAAKNKKEAAQKKLAELNNTEWQIELNPLAGKGKKEADVITFANNQISIAGFVKKGFPTTNFTLSVQDDGIVVWETMQTADKAGVAFWRGEMDLTMQSMRGVLSYQVDEKTKHDYSFVSTAKKNVPSSGK